MARYALVSPANTIDRIVENIDPGVGTKAGWRWLVCPVGTKPAYDPATETFDGPTYIVNPSDVTEVWTKRALTAGEISTAKDNALGMLDAAVYAALGKAFLSLENDNRIIKTKINALIVEQASTVPQFTAGQAAQITLAQLKAGFKALL